MRVVRVRDAQSLPASTRNGDNAFMALKISDRFPGGNVRVLKVWRDGDCLEVEFAPDPRGGIKTLWFDFRMNEGEAQNPEPPPGTLALTLRFAGNITGGGTPDTLRPVFREKDKNWIRLKAPDEVMSPDGISSLTWRLPYPAGPTEFAFCFPYGRDEFDTLLKRSKGYWEEREVGLTQEGRILKRVSNNIFKGCEACPNPHGLYIVARQHAGETPGSWVLDGMLDAISRAKPVNWCVWAVPFANLDDVLSGAYGKDPYPYDLNRAWGIGKPMRHETLVMQKDIHRWAERCKPELVLDLHAPGACDIRGVLTVGKHQSDDGEERDRVNEAWANVLEQSLKPDYAADPFVLSGNNPPSPTSPTLKQFVVEDIGCGALTVEIPYAMARGTLLMQRHYREIGQRIARAIIGRWTKN